MLQTFECFCTQCGLFLSGLVEEKEGQQVNNVFGVMATLKLSYSLALCIIPANLVFANIVLMPLSHIKPARGSIFLSPVLHLILYSGHQLSYYSTCPHATGTFPCSSALIRLGSDAFLQTFYVIFQQCILYISLLSLSGFPSLMVQLGASSQDPPQLMGAHIDWLYPSISPHIQTAL